MVQYIDKNALVAKIKRRRDAALIRQKNLESIGQETVLNEMVANELNKILSFINTLEVKEVDLEKEIDLRIGKLHTPLHYEELKDFAKHFFELGIKAQKGEEYGKRI